MKNKQALESKANTDNVVAQKALFDATTALDQANKNVSAQKKNLEAATLDADNKKKVADQAERDKTAADGKRDIQKKTVGNNQEILTQAQTDLSTKKSASEAADKNAQTAKNDLDKATAAQITAQTALDAAKQKVADDKNAISEATTTRDNAQSDLATKQAAEAEKESDVNTATTSQASAQKAVDDATTALEKAKNDPNYQAAKKKVDDLQKQAARLAELTKNKITIPDLDTFKAAFEDYQKNVVLNKDKFGKYMADARAANTFKSSKIDREQKVDINNLTNDQVEELSLFYADILNDLRTQVGFLPNLKVTKGFIDFAKSVAKQYEEDAKDGTYDYDPANKHSGHDKIGINDVSKRFGLDFDNTNSNQYYEDKGESSADKLETMDDLKGIVYDTINRMMFTDGHGYDTTGGPKFEMGHTAGILGADTVNYNPDSSFGDKVLVFQPASTALIARAEAAGDNYAFSLGNKYYPKDEYIKLIKQNIKDGQYVGAIVNKVNPELGFDTTHFFNVSPSYINDSDKFDTQHVVKSYADQIAENKDALDKANATLKMKKLNKFKLHKLI